MSTKIVDRRHSAGETTDPEADGDRMRRRQSVREQAARRDLHLQAALLAEADIRTSEERCDRLADDHHRLCEPWQVELQSLEEAAIGRIGRREPPDADEDERRGELTRLIADATSDLEKAITAEREIQSIARRKSRKTREGKPPADTILMALAKSPLASPKLLAEQHVCRERIKWLRARQQAAEKSLRIHHYNLSEIQAKRMSGDLGVFQGKVAAWETELAAVGDELTKATAESQTIHRAMLDE